MGWCSGTRAFDVSVSAAIDGGLKGKQLIDFAAKVMRTLEDMDWDCHQESDYYNDTVVKFAFMQEHPEWFDDDERD